MSFGTCRPAPWCALALLFLALPFGSSATGSFGSRPRSNSHEEISERRGEEIEKARREVLNILQTQNGCSAWFRESDPDAAEVFASLHIEITEEDSAVILQNTDSTGYSHFKHPWAARTHEWAGRDATVELNSSGPFFRYSLPVLDERWGSRVGPYHGFRALTVGPFRGDSLTAQMTTLLHELAHVIGRIPVDSDSWDGKSSQNTQEVLRSCKSEIQKAETTLRAAK